MSDMHWWERWEDIYKAEIAALNAKGISWQRNDAAAANGVLRLDLILPGRLGGHQVTVIYPEQYPYFRFQVYAYGLKLDYHQNPFERNLCLIGRRTDRWNTDDTAAGLIDRQLPKLLKSANTTDATEVEGLEELQAEPFSDYYEYLPESMILVQSDWSLPEEHRHGDLVVGLNPRQPTELPKVVMRGAVLQVRGANGQVLCSANPAFRRYYSGEQVTGRWVRLNAPIERQKAREFVHELLNIHPEVGDAKPHRVQINHRHKTGWLRVWGVLFPEQIAYRKTGQGWTFACVFDTKYPKAKKVRVVSSLHGTKRWIRRRRGRK
jgi:hypothetical protein